MKLILERMLRGSRIRSRLILIVRRQERCTTWISRHEYINDKDCYSYACSFSF